MPTIPTARPLTPLLKVAGLPKLPASGAHHLAPVPPAEYPHAYPATPVAFSGQPREPGHEPCPPATVLARNVFLTFSGAIGITEGSPDVTLGFSLPVRFGWNQVF